MLIQYLIKRLLIAIPVLLIVSLIIFMVVQLPPGDYIDTRIAQMQEEGQVDMAEINRMTELYKLDKPLIYQYWNWLTGFVQGDLGTSFKYNEPVTRIVGEFLPPTIAIASLTILFNWFIGLPLGLIAGVKRNTIYDYGMTFTCLIGLATPPFIIALILMAAMQTAFPGFDSTVLISRDVAHLPWYDYRVIVDFLKHIWIPVLILGIGGSADQLRIMRANIIDEMRKQYVVCALARGVHPIKVLLKYPFRIAINPFISTIGYILPELIGGSMIISIVMNLPTIGPKVLEAIQGQDTYLATSLVFIQACLAIIGIFISDILLSLVDPRIKYGKD